MINIAVLITCHNRKQKTIKCLQALFNQSHIENVKLKIFLVDDGSTDGTKQAINELFPDVIVIKGTGNLYWARGMSLAWQEAIKSKENFDYFLWLNDDTFLYNNAIKQIVNTAEELKKKNNNTNYIIAGSTCDSIKKIQTFGGYIINLKFYDLRFSRIQSENYLDRCDTFNGNCVLVPMSVFLKIGILNQNYVHRNGDFDYGLTATKNKIKCYVINKFIGTCDDDIKTYIKIDILPLFLKLDQIGHLILKK